LILISKQELARLRKLFFSGGGCEHALKKTYKAVTHGAEYAPDELVSLPLTLKNLHILVRELKSAGVQIQQRR
jgi:hypothetical protein